MDRWKSLKKKKKFRFPLDGEGQNEIHLMDATWHAKTLVGIIHQGYVGDSINGIRLSSVGLAFWIGSLLLWRGQWWNSIDRDVAKEKKKKYIYTEYIEYIEYINKVIVVKINSFLLIFLKRVQYLKLFFLYKIIVNCKNNSIENCIVWLKLSSFIFCWNCLINNY